MSPNTPTKSELQNAKKFPWQWAVIVLCGTVALLFGIYYRDQARADSTCEERIGNYRTGVTKRDSIIFYWQSKYITLSNELLYKNNIIDRQQEVIEKTDSIAHKKLEQPAKQIIKNHD